MLKSTFQDINLLKKKNGISWKHIFTSLVLISCFSVASQTPKNEADSLVAKLGIKNMMNPNSLENTVKKQEKEKQDKYFNDQSILKQNKILGLIKLEVENARFLLNKGFDYKDMTEEIDQLNVWEEFAVHGIVEKKFRVLTDRNLSSTSILLDELLNRSNKRLKNINIENHELSKTREKIDSLAAEKDLYYVPTDSVSKENYRLQLLKMNTDINLVSRRLKSAIDSIQTVEIQGDQLKYKIESDIVENNKLRQLVADQLFTKKEPVFEPLDIKTLLIDGPLTYSVKKNNLVLYFYLMNNRNSLLTMLILIIGTVVYFKLQKRKFLNLGYTNDMLTSINMLNTPVATAVLVVLNLYQFVLPMPPLIFSILLWTISTITLTVVMWKSISAFVWRIWIAIFLLNLMALFDLIFLIHVVGESYLIFTINCFGIAIGIYAFFNISKIQRKIYLWYIVIATILQVFSCYYLVNGHYNLAKFLMSKAVYTIIVVFSLYTAFVTIKELNTVSEFLKEADEDEPKNVISGVSHQFNTGFYLILFSCCFLLMTRNTYTFQSLLVEPIKNTISETRNIGDVKYTLENIITFILVILLSGFISRVVTFLASDSRIIDNKSKSKSIGSWVFLSRIAIVTIGVMVAFASLGIPFDKITLIISALGVGIGFGMQNLINNLISGLIIAFEKPVNLDDVIEVGGQSGKMKSIGIRSSVIATYDGADVVIPNGELLDNNLTNWTLGSNTRRSEIKFGVAYGTDLELTKNLLLEILMENENVLEKPEPPRIWFTKFNDYAIDVDIKYWIGHFDLDEDIKSELIIAIDKTLKKNNIFIPFQEHEIQIANKDSDKDLDKNSGPKPET